MKSSELQRIQVCAFALAVFACVWRLQMHHLHHGCEWKIEIVAGS